MIVKRFDEGNSTMDVTPETTEVRIQACAAVDISKKFSLSIYLLKIVNCIGNLKSYSSRVLVRGASASDHALPKEQITSFVNTYSMRLVTVFSPATSALLFGGPVKVHFILSC